MNSQFINNYLLYCLRSAYERQSLADAQSGAEMWLVQFPIKVREVLRPLLSWWTSTAWLDAFDSVPTLIGDWASAPTEADAIQLFFDTYGTALHAHDSRFPETNPWAT